MVQDLRKRITQQKSGKKTTFFGRKNPQHIPYKLGQSSTISSPIAGVLQFIFRIVAAVAIVLGRVLAWIFSLIRTIFYWFETRLGRIFFIQSIFVICVLLIVYNLWFVFSAGVSGSNANYLSSLKIIPAKRGTIYYRNLKFNKYIPLTSSSTVATITYNPNFLATAIKKNIYTLDDIVYQLAANLNIPYTEIKNTVGSAIAQEKPLQYAVLKKGASAEQGQNVDRLRSLTKNEKGSQMQYSLWLNYEIIESRVYPEQKTLASVVGYMQRYKSSKEDAYNIAQCRAMIDQNEKRNTIESFSGLKNDAVYQVGVYGLERKFCSELGGLNGREKMFSETRASRDSIVQNGADIYLTIDSTIQQRSEQILADLIKGTTEQGKPPRNGSIVVINLENHGEMKAGEILANASWPLADPNNYESEKYIESGGFSNVAVSEDYEVGSVMKPFTVAAAINEWFLGSKNAQGDRIGLSPDWKFVQHNPNETIYTEPGTGATYRIGNAEGTTVPAGVPVELKDCLAESLNTCMAAIEPHISNSDGEVENGTRLKHKVSEEYYKNRFGFGTPTLADTPPAAAGRVGNLSEYVHNTFQYANFAFGQGFEITPMQMVRGYTAIARTDGTMVEPHIVKSLHFDNGTIDTAETSSDPRIGVGKPVQVFQPQTSEHLNAWLRYSQDVYSQRAHQVGQEGSKRGEVEGYPIGGKTGTAQVGRPTAATKEYGCGSNESIYDCNLRLGITDQSYVQFGPIGTAYEKKYPKILVFVKVSEPRPGVRQNFASLNLAPYIAQMTKFTLEYLGVPPNL